MRRALPLLLVVLAVLLVAGCGGDDEPTSVQEASVYFLMDGKVWPVARELDDSVSIAAEALKALSDGPTDEEQDALELETAVTDDSLAGSVNDEGEFVLTGQPSTEALAQVVYTLTQFDTESVEIDGQIYTRADFEEQTPSVLVESPLPFAEVTAPITATGTANTFEANFQYELLDADGNVVDENFVTATSGTGTRGTFEFTTADVEGVATLVVFETSAEDGSRIREVEIPLNAP